MAEESCEKPAPRSEPLPPIEPRDDVRVLASRSRCPYCHADVSAEKDDWVACKACLARHHASCWRERGSCATCGHAVMLPARIGITQPSHRHGRIYLVGLGRSFLFLVSLVLLYASLFAWNEQKNESARFTDELQRRIAEDRRAEEVRRATPAPPPATKAPERAADSPRATYESSRGLIWSVRSAKVTRLIERPSPWNDRREPRERTSVFVVLHASVRNDSIESTEFTRGGAAVFQRDVRLRDSSGRIYPIDFDAEDSLPFRLSSEDETTLNRGVTEVWGTRHFKTAFEIPEASLEGGLTALFGPDGEVAIPFTPTR